jgi:hypothetical protein
MNYLIKTTKPPTKHSLVLNRKSIYSSKAIKCETNKNDKVEQKSGIENSWMKNAPNVTIGARCQMVSCSNLTIALDKSL